MNLPDQPSPPTWHTLTRRQKAWIGTVAALVLVCCYGALAGGDRDEGGAAAPATMRPMEKAGFSQPPLPEWVLTPEERRLPPGMPTTAAAWCATYIRAEWPARPEFAAPDDQLGQAAANLTTLTDATPNAEQLALIITTYTKDRIRARDQRRDRVIGLRSYLTASRLVGEPPQPDDGDGFGYGGGKTGLCFTQKPYVAPSPIKITSGRTDPRFSTCAKANANGYGPYYRGETEYAWYWDRDNDGIVCERR